MYEWMMVLKQECCQRCLLVVWAMGGKKVKVGWEGVDIDLEGCSGGGGGRELGAGAGAEAGGEGARVLGESCPCCVGGCGSSARLSVDQGWAQKGTETWQI